MSTEICLSWEKSQEYTFYSCRETWRFCGGELILRSKQVEFHKLSRQILGRWLIFSWSAQAQAECYDAATTNSFHCGTPGSFVCSFSNWSKINYQVQRSTIMGVFQKSISLLSEAHCNPLTMNHDSSGFVQHKHPLVLNNFPFFVGLCEKHCKVWQWDSVKLCRGALHWKYYDDMNDKLHVWSIPNPKSEKKIKLLCTECLSAQPITQLQLYAKYQRSQSTGVTFIIFRPKLKHLMKL